MVYCNYQISSFKRQHMGFGTAMSDVSIFNHSYEKFYKLCSNFYCGICKDGWGRRL
ncbi:hypothetical protein K170097C1_27730 [Hungatella effluvii]